MHLAVVGAAGRTGALVVAQALARGHAVRAIARDPDRIPITSPRLSVAAADARDPDGLRTALAGCDAVVSALGAGISRAPTDVYSRGAVAELAAMATHGITRLVVVSAVPAGPRDPRAPLGRRAALGLLQRLFGETYADMRRMEAVLRESTVDSVALRPPRLVGRPLVGAYRLDPAPLPGAGTLTFGDLATALLDVAEREDPRRAALYVAN